MYRENLAHLKRKYEEGGNIMLSLKNGDVHQDNTTEMIQTSYELQGGSYIQKAMERMDFIEQYAAAIARVINTLPIHIESLMEAGVGEATTLAHLIPCLDHRPSFICGFDIAWSRVRYGVAYAKKMNADAFLFMGDLFSIPLVHNSIDVIYTSHTIEPNAGKEKEALAELVRVAREYVILLEPAYELAGVEAQARMEKHGYIRQLHTAAIELGLNILEYRLFDLCSNPLNPTGLMVIKLNKGTAIPQPQTPPIMCPISKTPLSHQKGHYFTKEGLLVYPVVDGVPCLLRENAVIATHYLDNFELQ